MMLETRLAVREDHRQQDGYVHAGVLATVGDHTAGAAGATLTMTKIAIADLERAADGA